jgi:hypothetical protein
MKEIEEEESLLNQAESVEDNESSVVRKVWEQYSAKPSGRREK